MLSNYKKFWLSAFDFKGTIDEETFWNNLLFTFGVFWGMAFIEMFIILALPVNHVSHVVLFGSFWVVGGFVLLTLVPLISSVIRRLNALEKSHWYILPFFLAWGTLFTIYMMTGHISKITGTVSLIVTAFYYALLSDDDEENEDSDKK